MKRFKPCFVLPVLGLLPVFSYGQVSVDEHRFSKGQDGLWNLDWSGLPELTYFVQWSVDMVNWQYAPTIEFGLGSKQTRFDTTGRNQFFVRVVGVDDASITTLQQAKDADFDHDGISNLGELTSTNPTDPFDSEDPGGDDDLLNAFEYLIGSNPLVSYTLETMDTSLEIFLPNE
jgi:hypothetical protein